MTSCMGTRKLGLAGQGLREQWCPESALQAGWGLWGRHLHPCQAGPMCGSENLTSRLLEWASCPPRVRRAAALARPAPSLPAWLFWVSLSGVEGGSLGFGVAEQQGENGCKWPRMGPAAALLEGFGNPADYLVIFPGRGARARRSRSRSSVCFAFCVLLASGNQGPLPLGDGAAHSGQG